MRVYTVHYRPASPSPDRDAVLVKEGFCWPAFIVTAPWALWHRMWLAFVVMLAAGVALEVAVEFAGLDVVTAAAAGLGYSLFVGSEANDWRRRSLARRGYTMAGIVAAANHDAALRRFFDLNPEFLPGAPQPPVGAW